MKAYAFNGKNEFVGEVKMQKDPLESRKQKKEVYLKPANATDKAPPEITEEDKIAVFIDGEWFVREREKEEVAPNPFEEKEEIAPVEEEQPSQEELDAAKAKLDKINALITSLKNTKIKEEGPLKDLVEVFLLITT